MQIVLKTVFSAMLTMFSYSSALAGDNDVVEKSPPAMVKQSGHVDGYMSLPVADTSIDATYLSDKLGVNHGKVLILHDADGGIDAHGLVRTLRSSLTHAGWSTMTVSLQYPISPQFYLSTSAASAAENTLADTDEAETEAMGDTAPSKSEEQAEPDKAANKAPDNSTRVAAALTYLNAQQPGPTVLIAIGESATLTDTVTSQLGEQRGLVWIAPEITLETPPDVMPILDIAATAPGADNDKALNRKRLMRQNQMQQYSQRLISGAGHSFFGFENRVVTYVRGWLFRHFVEKAES